MGYVLVAAPCIVCKRVFQFSPTRVPSVVVDGSREPICRACVEAANPKRIASGLEPIEILDGAYEADDEEEVDWGDDYD